MRLHCWAFALLAVVGCRERDTVDIVPGGSVAAGKDALHAYGCGACHEIHGVPEANGLVGPPLSTIRDRTLIAGQLPNSVDNLIAWIRDPKRYVPGTGMPNLGVSERDARNMVAYLYRHR